MSIRTRLNPLVAVLALAAAAPACSDEPSSAPPSETPGPVSAARTATATASSPAPDEPEPLRVYRAAWEVLNASSQAPNERDWTEDYKAVFADPALNLALEDLRSQQSNGEVFVGQTRINPELAAEGPNSATITDCIDISESESFQNGTPVSLAPDQLLQYRLDAVLAEVGDVGWRVTELRPRRTEPC